MNDPICKGCGSPRSESHASDCAYAGLLEWPYTDSSKMDTRPLSEETIALLTGATPPEPQRGPTMSDWQPIETAPQDGRNVLLAVAGCEWLTNTGWYILGRGWVIRADDEGTTYFKKCGHEPTHWMPLPPAPTNRSEGGGE